MKSPIQRKLNEEERGVFDLSGADVPEMPKPKNRPEAQSTQPKAQPTAQEDPEKDVGSVDVGSVIGGLEAIQFAAANLEGGGAVLRSELHNTSAANGIDRIREDLLGFVAKVYSDLYGELAQYPDKQKKLFTWMTKQRTGQPEKKVERQRPAPLPPAQPVAPPPAPVPQQQTPPAPVPAPAPARMESKFMGKLDNALIEDGVTKEKPKTSQEMTTVWTKLDGHRAKGGNEYGKGSKPLVGSGGDNSHGAHTLKGYKPPRK